MQYINSIGGYFGLEMGEKNNTLFEDAILLNSARNCFKYILQHRKYKKVFLPYFTCDVLLEPLNALKVEYEFYEINEELEPVFDETQLTEDVAFLVVNYFGLKTQFIQNLSIRIQNLIVDNAQALFAPALKGVDTFYSPRKFIGIPDGGILYSNLSKKNSLAEDNSYNRMSHLIKRLAFSAENGYPDYVKNEELLKDEPIKLMSSLTKRIIKSVDFSMLKEKRKSNFNYLNEQLKTYNLLDVQLNEASVPLVYPFRIKNGEELRAELIANKIYCATYWPNVFEWRNENSVSYKLAKEIVALPIDQRYGQEEMDKVLKIIIKYI